MSEVASRLAEAKALIADQDNWCQNQYEIDNGYTTQRCALSAISTAYGYASDCRWFSFDMLNAIYAFTVANGISHIPDFNDTHTHAEVMAAFDKAIEYERARSIKKQAESIMRDAMQGIAPAPEVEPITGKAVEIA